MSEQKKPQATSMPVHVVVVTDTISACQGLYVGGELQEQCDTIYACDIARHTEGLVIEFSSIDVTMPEGVNEYPQRFEECLLWSENDRTPATPCPDCGAPLTDGHADVCPMAWVTQDRVAPRGGLDQWRWMRDDGTWYCDWQLYQLARDIKNGFIDGDFTLHVRCRRKDLPPLPEPENPIPTPCNLGPGFSPPVDQVRVRLWADADGSVHHTEQCDTVRPGWQEITVNNQGQFWMRRTGK